MWVRFKFLNFRKFKMFSSFVIVSVTLLTQTCEKGQLWLSPSFASSFSLAKRASTPRWQFLVNSPTFNPALWTSASASRHPTRSSRRSRPICSSWWITAIAAVCCSPVSELMWASMSSVGDMPSLLFTAMKSMTETVSVPSMSNTTPRSCVEDVPTSWGHDRSAADLSMSAEELEANRQERPRDHS